MTADSKAYFAEVATRWDTLRAGFFSEHVREVAYATAAIQQGNTAADIGAGTGFMTEGLVERGYASSLWISLRRCSTNCAGSSLRAPL